MGFIWPEESVYKVLLAGLPISSLESMREMFKRLKLEEISLPWKLWEADPEVTCLLLFVTSCPLVIQDSREFGAQESPVACGEKRGEMLFI